MPSGLKVLEKFTFDLLKHDQRFWFDAQNVFHVHVNLDSSGHSNRTFETGDRNPHQNDAHRCGREATTKALRKRVVITHTLIRLCGV